MKYVLLAVGGGEASGEPGFILVVVTVNIYKLVAHTYTGFVYTHTSRLTYGLDSSPASS